MKDVQHLWDCKRVVKQGDHIMRVEAPEPLSHQLQHLDLVIHTRINCIGIPQRGSQKLRMLRVDHTKPWESR